MMSARRSQMIDLIDRITPMDAEERIDAILGEIMATGKGQLVLGLDGAGEQRDFSPVEIDLFGITVQGRDISTACAQWISAAMDRQPIERARITAALRCIPHCAGSSSPD